MGEKSEEIRIVADLVTEEGQVLRHLVTILVSFFQLELICGNDESL